jgi:hypothetical protein
MGENQLAVLELPLMYLRREDFSRDMLHDTFIRNLLGDITFAYHCTHSVILGHPRPPEIRICTQYNNVQSEVRGWHLTYKKKVICHIEDICKEDAFPSNLHLHLKIDGIDYELSLVDATIETLKPFAEMMFDLFDDRIKNMF